MCMRRGHTSLSVTDFDINEKRYREWSFDCLLKDKRKVLK